MSEPTKVDIFMDPEQFGDEVCLNCNGYGSSLMEASDRCSKCGGSGVVKKEEV